MGGWGKNKFVFRAGNSQASLELELDK